MTENMKKRTFQIPFTETEWNSLKKALFSAGYKTQGYIRKLIVTDMIKRGWLSIQQTEAEND